MDNVVPYFSRVDRIFDESNIADCDFILQVTEQSCSYSIFDRSQNRYLALESYDLPLVELASRKPWPGNSFRSVHIIIENNRNTLIPASMFEESEKRSYLDFALELSNEEIIRTDNINTLGIVNVFSINEQHHDVIKSIFPGSVICHITSCLIETIWMNFKNLISEKRIFIFFRRSDFNLLIYDKKQLIYSNAFHFREPEDVVYFVIFVMEQLNLNPEEVPVTLLGNIETGSSHYDLLFRYIRNVEFADRNETLNYSPVFNDVPGHDWYSLLNPVRCGS